MISKNMGGVGLDVSNIRHSKIGYFGRSAGIVPMLKVFNDALKYADQGGGRRKGSGTIFLQPWHVDFPEFLELKRQQGSDDFRARDLFYSVWCCDLFMDRVSKNMMWSLFCPKKAPGLTETYNEEFEHLYTSYEEQHLYEKQIPAQTLWNELLKTQVETGMPFITHKDTANSTSNQKNLGIIRSSNLCVSGDTFILTRDGNKKIKDLVGVAVDIWNGDCWSTVTPFCTSAIPKKLLTVTMNDGSTLNCTPEHIFYIGDFLKNTKKTAAELVSGDKLIYWQIPGSLLSVYPQHKTGYVYHEVVSVIDKNIMEPTFCFTEPRRHTGVFNGILTGQCQEIMEVSDENRISSCNLASICLNMFVENGSYNFKKLGDVTRKVVRALNNVIDTTYYPLENYPNSPIKTTNLKYRPLGIGVQGLADAFMLMGYPWESNESKKLNKEIFACIYYHAVDESSELAREFGSYDGFIGSPASKGLLKPDLVALEMARKKIKYSSASGTIYEVAGKILNENLVECNNYNWSSLRMKIAKNGLRNSLLIALMPTASTAQILGNTESFEPISSNIYSRSVLSGNHVVINRYMVETFSKLGIWNRNIINSIIKNDGSVQHLDIDEHYKKLYKTAFEIKQKVIVDLSIDRSFYVCQSQSLNIHIKNPTFAQLTSLHFYAWENCLSTGMYYLRTAPSVDAVKFTVEGEIDVKKKVVCTDEVCVTCQS
jgi:ribonucleotide reductase alpha subunit